MTVVIIILILVIIGACSCIYAMVDQIRGLNDYTEKLNRKIDSIHQMDIDFLSECEKTMAECDQELEAMKNYRSKLESDKFMDMQIMNRINSDMKKMRAQYYAYQSILERLDRLEGKSDDKH